MLRIEILQKTKHMSNKILHVYNLRAKTKI